MVLGSKINTKMLLLRKQLFLEDVIYYFGSFLNKLKADNYQYLSLFIQIFKAKNSCHCLITPNLDMICENKKNS